MTSLSAMMFACEPSQRHSRISRSVCLPSTAVADMGVIFFIATLPPVSAFMHAITTPYAPLPRSFWNVYFFGSLKAVPAGSGRRCEGAMGDGESAAGGCRSAARTMGRAGEPRARRPRSARRTRHVEGSEFVHFQTRRDAGSRRAG